jgi:hypothetical protein
VIVSRSGGSGKLFSRPRVPATDVPGGNAALSRKNVRAVLAHRQWPHLAQEHQYNNLSRYQDHLGLAA